MDYGNYLKIESLLSLQQTKSNFEEAEQIFIVTHQAIELWLKVLLNEIIVLKKAFISSRFSDIISHVDKCIILVDMMVGQFKALKALSPLEFSNFRASLGWGSMRKPQIFPKSDSNNCYY